MGQCCSAEAGHQESLLEAKNDYELVIRASKELEHVLEVCFGAQGKGLHEKVSSIEHLLSKDLVRKIRYLATIRNKLVHERDFNEVPDRPKFLDNFRAAQAELNEVLARQGKQPPKARSDDLCIIM